MVVKRFREEGNEVIEIGGIRTFVRYFNGCTIPYVGVCKYLSTFEDFAYVWGDYWEEVANW